MTNDFFDMNNSKQNQSLFSSKNAMRKILFASGLALFLIAPTVYSQDKDDKNKDKKEGEDKEDKGGDQKDDSKQEPEKPDDKGDPKDKKEEKGDQEKEQQTQPQPGQLSAQQIKNLLEAMNNEEKKVQEKINAQKARGAKTRTGKDW